MQASVGGSVSSKKLSLPSFLIPPVILAQNNSPKSTGSASTAYSKMQAITNLAKSTAQTGSTSSSSSSASNSSGSTGSTNSVKSNGSKSATVSSSGGGGGSSATKANPLQDLMNYLKQSSDAYYNTQVAGLAKDRDAQIAQLQKNYLQAVSDGNLSIDEANKQFNDAVKQINTQAYNDSQLTQLYGFDRGIQNSQQLMGLMSGDNARTNTMTKDVTTQRDERVNQLKDRLAQIAKQKNEDVAQANNDYNYNVTQARGTADQQYNDGVFKLKYDQYQNSQNSPQYRSSGGGDYSVKKPTAITLNQQSSPLSQAYNDFKSAQQNTTLDNYYQKQKQIFQPIPYKNPIMPIPSPGNNQQLSSWEKYRMITGGL